jgi:hypothetical protein
LTPSVADALKVYASEIGRVEISKDINVVIRMKDSANAVMMLPKGDGSGATQTVRKFGGGVDGFHLVEVAVSKDVEPAHSVGINDQGQVYTWGCNPFGVLGHGTDDESEDDRPRRVEALANKCVVGVSSTNSYSAVCTSEGEVYTWGHAKGGKLGHDPTVALNVPQPVRGVAGVHISQVSCGFNHVLALSQDGSVWGWGRNDWGMVRPWKVSALRAIGLTARACSLVWIACLSSHLSSGCVVVDVS